MPGKTRKIGRRSTKKISLGKLNKYKKTMKRMNKKLAGEKFNALFSYFDTNRNRNIDFKEFKRGLRSKLSHTKISDKDLKSLFNYFDLNKNRNIDYHEFKKGLVGGQPVQPEAPVKGPNPDPIVVGEGEGKNLSIEFDDE
jgi:Ca2+-binding EF-hand superfamily protein